ncbi:cell death protein 3, partial [Aplysia californica]|uniref:Cell death protein 3 n=1 Tax=Aplysia californica TaxID=6500 RepID=A0ABM0KB09_APLCA
MEKEQKEILITRRVELVENLNMDGGLFTQLMAKKILNQRTVNNIKMKRTPEEQAEELLNYLPKKDCFERFCEALEADDQEEIVTKYLKVPSKTSNTPAVTAEQPQNSANTVASPTAAPSRNSSLPAASVETIDAAIQPPSVQPVNSQPTISVIRIKEPDNNHLCIEYQNTSASPQKKMRLEEITNGSHGYEEDSTRYVNKHFIAQESDRSLSCNNSLSVVPVLNPQSVAHNPNVSDPVRYMAAYAQQTSQGPASAQLTITGQASLPLVPPPSMSSASPMTNSPAHIPQPFRPDLSTVQPFPQLSRQSDPLTRFPSNEAGHQYSHPHQYLSQHGLLPPSQKHASVPAATSGQPPPVADYNSLTHAADAVDTMTIRIHGREISQVDGSTPPQNGQGSELSSVTLNAAAGPAINLSAPPLPMSSLPAAAASPSPTLTPTLTAPSPVAVPAQQNISIPSNIPSDMEHMDLPDGCVNVKVEHSSRQFFINNYKKSYPLHKIPRGLFLIINVDEVEGKPPRKGTNFDRDNLMNLLCQLHFEPVVYNDSDGLSAQEIVIKLQDFARRKEHKRADACVICLLSHGEEGYIFGTDGKRIPLDEIFLLFGNTNCKELMGKPKVFIIQACRGGILDKGVRMDEPDGGTLPNMPVAQLPTMSDMLIGCPTMAGYYAWRNRARGSWYIEAIVQVFMKYAKCEDICVMLNRVNQLVSRKVSECNQKEMNQMSQMSEYKSSLRQPHFYLFPGI